MHYNREILTILITLKNIEFKTLEDKYYKKILNYNHTFKVFTSRMLGGRCEYVQELKEQTSWGEESHANWLVLNFKHIFTMQFVF